MYRKFFKKKKFTKKLNCLKHKKSFKSVKNV